MLTYHLRETMPDDEILVVTITDETGERVRQLELPQHTGMQRVAWDLRHDPPPPPPEGTGPQRRRRQRQGAVVSPGRYVATLGRLAGETLTPLGDPQTILVTELQW